MHPLHTAGGVLRSFRIWSDVPTYQMRRANVRDSARNGLTNTEGVCNMTRQRTLFEMTGDIG